MLVMMGGDTTRNMYSSFPEIHVNKLRNVTSCWKYIKRNTVEQVDSLATCSLASSSKQYY